MKFSVWASIASLICEVHAAPILLMPYLVLISIESSDFSTWASLFRVTSTLFFGLPPLLRLVELKWRYRLLLRLVTATQSAMGYCISLALLLFTVVFGMGNATSVFAQQKDTSSGLLDTASCTTTGSESTWSALFYCVGLAITLSLDAAALFAFVLLKTKSPVSEVLSHTKDFPEKNPLQSDDNFTDPNSPRHVTMATKDMRKNEEDEEHNSVEVAPTVPTFPQSNYNPHIHNGQTRTLQRKRTLGLGPKKSGF